MSKVIPIDHGRAIRTALRKVHRAVVHDFALHADALKVLEMYIERLIEIAPPSRLEDLAYSVAYVTTELDLALANPQKKSVQLADGSNRKFDALLLATGAEPVKLRIPGGDSPQVCYLRSLSDCRAIIGNAAKARRVVLGRRELHCDGGCGFADSQKAARSTLSRRRRCRWREFSGCRSGRPCSQNSKEAHSANSSIFWSFYSACGMAFLAISTQHVSKQ